MLRSTGTFQTPHASKHLARLCKDFAHKTEASFDDRQGQVALQMAPDWLTADATGLTITIAAPDAESLPAARFTIDKHLAIFTLREGFGAMTWGAAISA